MDKINEQINRDLDYYRSGIKQLYQRSYQMYIFGLIAAMLLTVTGIGLSTSILRGLLILTFVVEIAGLLYLLRFLSETSFEAYFKEIPEKLIEAFPVMQESAPQEDNQTYYFLDSQGELIKLNKKNIRNFPSAIKQYTLLVGFNYETDNVRFKQPLHFYYYDITAITHSDNYKKEILKNTNFLAKRRKRRIRRLILTLICLVLAGTAVYFGAKMYFNDNGLPIVVNKLKEASELDTDLQKTTIQSMNISRGNETIKLKVPKELRDQLGYFMDIPEKEEGYSYQSFMSEAYFIDISMMEKSTYNDFSEYLKYASQTRDEDSVDQKSEKLHEDFFIEEYREQAKEDSEQEAATVYYFESNENYGSISVSLNGSDQLDLPKDMVLTILKELEVERKESVL